jgi:hypothetical protein
MAFTLQSLMSPNAWSADQNHEAPGASARTDSDIISGNLLVA